MICYPKSQFSKNNIKIIQSKLIQHKCQNELWKMMPFAVLYHGPNTTHLAHISVLGYSTQACEVSTEGVTSCHLIIPETVQSD